MPKKLDQFLPPISANVTKQKLSLQRGTIQVLRQQRGGWVGWPNADCLRRKKISEHFLEFSLSFSLISLNK